MDTAAATAVSLNDVFAAGRGGFLPMTLAASADGFRAHPLRSVEPPVPPVADVDPLQFSQADLDAAIEAGYAAGHAAASEAAAAATQAVRDQVASLVQSLDRERSIDRASLGALLRTSVLDLVRQVVGTHVAADPMFINGCVGRVLSTLKESHEKARLLLHPDDVALIDRAVIAGLENLSIAPDPELPRGAVRLETAGGEVEGGVQLQLARLEERLSSIIGVA